MQNKKVICKILSSASILSFLGFFCFPYFTNAQLPEHVNYQGKLKDGVGNPIISSTTIQFSLYSHITNGAPTDAPSSVGPLLWTETYDGSAGCTQITPGIDGIFAQLLGSCVSFPSYLDFTDEYYLGVKIGTDAEATPRVSLATNPYAFTSKAVHAEGEDVNIDTETSGNIVLNSAGNIQLQANDTTSAFIVDQQGSGNLFELQNNGTMSFIVDENGFVGIGGIFDPGKLLEVNGTAGYLNASDMGITDADFASKGYVDGQLMWEIIGDRIQPKNNSVRQIYVREDSNSYTQFMVRNDNDTGNGAGAIIELKGSGADYTNNMYIGKYGASFWIPELQDNGAVLTDKNLVIGTASDSHEIHFVTGNSYMDLQPVVVADNEGFRYTSDLSATFVDRTLVDKEYVDNAILLGANNIYTADGILTEQREVSLDGNNLLFNGAGNIGIGVANPINKFQVNGNVRATRLVGSNGTSGSPTFRFDSDSDTGMFRATTNQLAFATGGNERMRIDHNGNMGIGVTIPSHKLVVGGNAYVNSELLVGDSAVIHTKHTYEDKFLGTELTWNLLQTFDGNMDPNDEKNATITSGVGSKETFPITRWKVGDESTNGTHYGYVGYFPEESKSFIVNTDKETSLSLGVGAKHNIFIETGGGRVGVNTTSPSQSFQVGDAGDGTVAISNAWNTFSDRRWKKNITPLKNSLEKIITLEGVNYDWKNGGTENNMGFIAQDVQDVFPEIVSEDPNGYLSISYDKLVAPLVEAIKEQQKQIEQLNGGNIIDNAQSIITELKNDIRNVLEEVAFTKEVEFEDVVTFFADAVFTDEVTFMERVTYVDKDVAGSIIIEKDENKVEVAFESEFTFVPFVTAVVNNEFILFKITDVTENGFVIEIENDAQKDIQFTWQAVSVADKNGETINDSEMDDIQNDNTADGNESDIVDEELDE